MSKLRSTRSDLLGAVAAGLIVLVFCLILLWRDPGVFWNDDYQLSILPVFADIARSWNEGHWPLLSPSSWVCSNLAGEFQYGTFSIFINAAVILIWKFPLTFSQQAAALSITHLFFLAAGAFLLARDRTLSVALSIFVALVATLNGWMICWAATDWFGALGALTWLPWAWWGLEKSLRVSTPNAQHSTPNVQGVSGLSVGRWTLGVGRLLPALWPAPFVYLLVTGGFPYTIGMLGVLVAWLSIKSLVEAKSLTSIMPMLFGVALGFGLSAPAWIAIFDYVHGSARELQPAATHWQWLVPASALPALILPSWTVNWADFGTRYLPHAGTELACGLVAPVALVSVVIRIAIRDSRIAALESIRKIRWELFLLLLVLVFAMLPSAGMFRWSFRWLPFFHLILALGAAKALQLHPRPALTALVALFLGAIAMSIFHTSGRFTFPLVWISIGIAALWFGSEVLVRNDQAKDWLPASVTFAALLATYLCLPTNYGVPKYNLSQELVNPAPLDPQRLYLSLYSWTEITYDVGVEPKSIGQIVRPGSTSMWGGLRFINGYSPILAAGVSREFKTTTHGEIDWLVGKNLLEQQAGSDGDLARLGVDGIVIAREIKVDPQPSSEWELALSNDEGRVFHRRGPAFATVRSDDAMISRIEDSRNRVSADVDPTNSKLPALIRFSRPYFPGYEARIDGKKLTVGSDRGLYPTVELPPNARGRLVLTYCPLWLKLGAILSILSGLTLIAGFVAAVVSGGRVVARQ